MNCPNCGTPLKETSFNRQFCPNCGIIDDNSIEEKEDKEDRPREYIG